MTEFNWQDNQTYLLNLVQTQLSISLKRPSKQITKDEIVSLYDKIIEIVPNLIPIDDFKKIDQDWVIASTDGAFIFLIKEIQATAVSNAKDNDVLFKAAEIAYEFYSKNKETPPDLFERISKKFVFKFSSDGNPSDYLSKTMHILNDEKVSQLRLAAKITRDDCDIAFAIEPKTTVQNSTKESSLFIMIDIDNKDKNKKITTELLKSVTDCANDIVKNHLPSIFGKIFHEAI